MQIITRLYKDSFILWYSSKLISIWLVSNNRINILFVPGCWSSGGSFIPIMILCIDTIANVYGWHVVNSNSNSKAHVATSLECSSSNIIINCQKWGKYPYQNMSLWRTLKIILLRLQFLHNWWYGWSALNVHALSKHVTPLCERTNHQFVKRIRCDFGNTLMLHKGEFPIMILCIISPNLLRINFCTKIMLIRSVGVVLH